MNEQLLQALYESNDAGDVVNDSGIEGRWVPCTHWSKQIENPEHSPQALVYFQTLAVLWLDPA